MVSVLTFFLKVKERRGQEEEVSGLKGQSGSRSQGHDKAKAKGFRVPVLPLSGSKLQVCLITSFAFFLTNLSY